MAQMDYVICTAVTTWSDPEAVILLEKVNEYQNDVGPMKKFKNKKSMWEKISGDILSELGSLKTAAQCENRYKTVRKRKGWVDSNQQQTEKAGSNSVPSCSKELSPKRKRFEIENINKGTMQNQTEADSESLISKSQDLGESIEEVDVRRGVGQVSFNIACESNDEEEKRDSRKRLRQTLSSVLLQIHREKEEAKERRHQEKMELLKLLFQ